MNKYNKLNMGRKPIELYALVLFISWLMYWIAQLEITSTILKTN